jgi:hypothetical protein
MAGCGGCWLADWYNGYMTLARWINGYMTLAVMRWLSEIRAATAAIRAMTWRWLLAAIFAWGFGFRAFLAAWVWGGVRISLWFSGFPTAWALGGAPRADASHWVF